MICVVLIAIALIGFTTQLYGAGDNATVAEDLEKEIEQQLKDLDLGEFETMLDAIDDDLGIFKGSFFDKIGQALSGKFDSAGNVFTALIKVFFSDLFKLLPLISVIAAIAILANLLQGLNSRPETSRIIYYACFCGVLLAVTVSVFSVMNLAKDAVLNMQKQMNLTFPILLTLMSAIGSVSSVAVYRPMVALLSQGVASLMTYVILPVFVVAYILTIVSSLSPEIRMNRLADMFSSMAKWLIGIVFTIFSAFLSVQGIYAGIHDGVSFRTAKYAISHYIPLVGGYLSDGLNMILAGSMLIKNAVGVVSILLLFATVLGPLMSVVCLKLILMLLGAVLEPLQNNEFAAFCSKLSKSLNLLIAVMVSVAFMYFISLVLLICSANYVVGI